MLHGTRAGEWEGSSTPSNRVWLGNISATATLRSVRSVFSKFGALTDAAVFPARIGPLGYAFVNFEKVADAAGAYQALNNVVLPALTGCKQLKMRFKPAKVIMHVMPPPSELLACTDGLQAAQDAFQACKGEHTCHATTIRTACHCVC